MSLEKDSGELRKVFEKINEAAPSTAPAKPQTEPGTKPETTPRPEKPRSPIAPEPGVSPKPKAEENDDVKLFLRKRGIGEKEVSPGLKKWRRRQGKGKIMKPSTFKDIEKKAKAGGATDPEKVAGAAYWKTAKAKYKNREK